MMCDKNEVQFDLAEWMTTKDKPFDLKAEFLEQCAPHLEAFSEACQRLGIPFVATAVVANDKKEIACRVISNFQPLNRVPAELLLAYKAAKGIAELDAVHAHVKTAATLRELGIAGDILAG